MLDQLWANEPRLTKDLKPILRELTNLVRGETSTVSLKARTILIASEKPSYEIRHNHIEKMFLDAINKSDDSSQVKVTAVAVATLPQLAYFLSRSLWLVYNFYRI